MFEEMDPAVNITLKLTRPDRSIGIAFFDATAVRLRQFPMTPRRVLAALKSLEQNPIVTLASAKYVAGTGRRCSAPVLYCLEQTPGLSD
jgi:hypothetical protein